MKATALPLFSRLVSPQRLRWLEDRALDTLVWTPALNTTSVEWHTWQAAPKAAAFTAGRLTKEHPVHKTLNLQLSVQKPVAFGTFGFNLLSDVFCYIFQPSSDVTSFHSLSSPTPLFCLPPSLHQPFPYFPPLADYNIKLSHKSN